MEGLLSVVGLIVSFGLAEGRVTRFYARFIKVEDCASGVGLIISCGLAVGGLARFYTRCLFIEVARVVEGSDWRISSVLLEEVLVEDVGLQRRGHIGAGA